ncbi:MAG: molybdenum cofactor guanylyltransferase [Eubacteriales bacterium]
MNVFGSAIILAGGKSSRMGFDKQELTINNVKLMTILLKKLNKVFKEIIVVTQMPGHYHHLPCITVSDEIKNQGPLGGIHRGLKEASSEYVYVIACDMPNITIDYIHYMMHCIEEKNVKACITNFGEWIEPFNAFYAKSTVPLIEEFLSKGNRSIYYLIDQWHCYHIEEAIARKFSPGWDMFLNLNTKEELLQYTKTI